MANILADRLKSLLEKSGRSARAISIATTGKSDVVRDILRGKVVNARADTVRNLARELESSVAFLTGETDDPRPHRTLTNSGLVAARVIGVAQAGAFMDVDAAVVGEHFDPEWVPTVRDPRFPDIEPIAFEIAGDSIDRECKAGGYAICLPWAETGLRLRPGMWVVAERARGEMVERTVKRVQMVNGVHFELHPFSTNKKHKPITFPSAEPTEEVRVVAVVYRFISPPLPL